MTASSHSGRARVAPTHLEVIPEGDGVPSTHTHLAAVPDRKVASVTVDSAPHPFAARHPQHQRIAALAIILVATVLAASATCAVTGRASSAALVAIAVAVFGLAVAAPSLAGRRTRADRELAHREQMA